MMKHISGQLIIAYSLIFCIAIFSHSAVCCGQFYGDDEPIQLYLASQMIDASLAFDFVGFVKAIVPQAHPPLRYLLSIPGLLLFPNSEFGLRFGASLISFYMTYQVIKLGQDLGGNMVGFTSGALIAGSAVYNWTSMAFGWSLTVVMLIHSIRLLRSNSLDLATPAGKRSFILVNIFVIVAFLVNSGNVLFFGSTLLVYFLANRDKFYIFVKWSSPFILFYGLYYAFFLVVVPYVMSEFAGIATPVGQYRHLLSRSGYVYLNYTSFLENIRGLNGYLLPYVSWVFLICSVYYLVKNERVIAIWISLFAIAWSFFMTNQSHQYFLLVFISIFPFGVKFIYDKLSVRPFIALSFMTGLLILLWNYQVFIKQYGYLDPNYPQTLISWGNAHIGRTHNIVQPYQQIGTDIDALLGPDKHFVHDLTGAFTMFYYPTPKYAGRFGNEQYPYVYDEEHGCYTPLRGFYDDINIIITDKNVCSTEIAQQIAYPNSNIRLYLLQNPLTWTNQNQTD